MFITFLYILIFVQPEALFLLLIPVLWFVFSLSSSLSLLIASFAKDFSMLLKNHLYYFIIFSIVIFYFIVFCFSLYYSFPYTSYFFYLTRSSFYSFLKVFSLIKVVFKAINFILRINLPPSHHFWCVMFLFSFSSKYF